MNLTRSILLAVLLGGCSSSATISTPRAQAPEPSPRPALVQRQSPAARLLLRAEAEASRTEQACADRRDDYDCVDYAPAIATLTQLLARYPGSAAAVVALDPLGYFFDHTGQTDRAREVWLSAVCPEVEGTPSVEMLHGCRPLTVLSAGTQFDVWSRLGESWFDGGNAELASIAYQRAVAVAPTDHPSLGVVQYRYAWSLFRLDQYAPALDAFAAVRDDRLDAEALEFMATIASEPDWNGDGAPDAASGLDRPELRAWVETWDRAPALVARLARTWGEMLETGLARRACEHFLARWPNDPAASEVRGMLARLP